MLVISHAGKAEPPSEPKDTAVAGSPDPAWVSVEEAAAREFDFDGLDRDLAVASDLIPPSGGGP